jgi:hypothetical protein
MQASNTDEPFQPQWLVQHRKVIYIKKQICILLTTDAASIPYDFSMKRRLFPYTTHNDWSSQ